MTHRLGMLLILVLVLSNIGLLGFSYISYYNRSIGEFFGAIPEKIDFPLQSLDRPSVSTNALLNWATLAATATFTIDFVNYEQNLESLKQYFTEAGYRSFINALTEQGSITVINEKKLVLTAVAIGSAVVSSESEEKNVHTWTVEVPITVTYLSVSTEEKANKVVTMTITQVPIDVASKGIGIERYVASDLGSDFTG